MMNSGLGATSAMCIFLLILLVSPLASAETLMTLLTLDLRTFKDPSLDYSVSKLLICTVERRQLPSASRINLLSSTVVIALKRPPCLKLWAGGHSADIIRLRSR